MEMPTNRSKWLKINSTLREHLMGRPLKEWEIELLEKGWEQVPQDPSWRDWLWVKFN